MAEQENNRQSNSDKEREQRLAQQKAEREERRAKEQAQREERKAKEAAARNTKPSKGALEKQAAREAAKGYGIDTKGMSAREIKAAVVEASAAEKKLEEDMGKFIEKTLNNFIAKKSGEVAPSDIPPSTTNRISEDKPTLMPSSGGSSPKGQTNVGTPIKFYCYYDGLAGYIELFGIPVFETEI